MHVIGYTRVSTLNQAEEGVSLAAQAEKITAYTVVKDWTLTELIEDAGVSAKSLVRPGLQRLLSIIDKGQTRVVMVTKLDRLTRSVVDLGHLMKRFEKIHVALVSLQESLDATTATGERMMNLLISVSQWERKVIGERTHDAMQHLKATGQVYSRPVCTDRALIAWMKEQRLHGQSYHAIASTLIAEGTTSTRGGQWTAMTVPRILQRQSPTPSIHVA
jgi:site-specific DNA recombinase